MASRRTGLALFVLLTAASAGQAASFGTLFTTAEQRERLDNALPVGPTAASAGATGPAGDAATAREIRLDGTIVSSLGRREVWLNGAPASRHTPAGVRRVHIERSGNVDIRLDHAAASRSLKPGQIYLPDSGEVREGWQYRAQQDLPQTEPEADDVLVDEDQAR